MNNIEKKTKILIIDDCDIVCSYMEAEMEYQGYFAKSVLSGEEAVELLKNEEFDIAIIDLMLGGIDGVETCRRIKKIQPDIEAVLFSGHPEQLEESIEAFAEAGGRNEFMNKPLILEKALAMIEKIVSEKKK